MINSFNCSFFEQSDVYQINHLRAFQMLASITSSCPFSASLLMFLNRISVSGQSQLDCIRVSSLDCCLIFCLRSALLALKAQQGSIFNLSITIFGEVMQQEQILYMVIPDEAQLKTQSKNMKRIMVFYKIQTLIKSQSIHIESIVLMTSIIELQQQIYCMIKYDAATLTPIKQTSKIDISTPVTVDRDQGASRCDYLPLNDLQSFLVQGRCQQALNLLSPSSFLRQLVCDHIEVAKMQDILFPSAQVVRINLKSNQIISLEREARLKTVLTLRGNRGINIVLTNQISDYLQDILFDQFEPLKSFSSNPSNVFVQLYQKLNKIQQKIDLLKANSPGLPQFLQKHISQVVSSNRQLKERLEQTQFKVVRFQRQAETAVHQSTFLKKQIETLHLLHQQHQQEKITQQNLLNEYMKTKDQQYIKELEELRNGKSSKVSQFKSYLNYSINDLQNLIQRLSQQNKLLKEEKDLLLAKISRIYEKFSVLTNLYTEKCEPVAIEPYQPEKIESHYEQRKEIIKGLKQKMNEFQTEIAEKNQTIFKINEQLEELRRQKLNHSIMESSISSSSNEQTLKSRKYKRTRIDEQALEKIAQLEELRRKDKEIIDELSSTIEHLNHTITKQNTHKINESQNTVQSEKESKSRLNFVKVLEYQENEQVGRNLEVMTDKIKKLQATIEEQRNTNASLNTVDFHDMQKRLEEQLTPKMDQIEELAKKCKNLERQIMKMQTQKEKLVEKHEEEIQDMQLKNGENELSLITKESKIEQLEYELSKKEKQLKQKNADDGKQYKEVLIELKVAKDEKLSLELTLQQKNLQIAKLDSLNMQLKQQLDDISTRLKNAQTTMQFTRQRALTAQKKYKSIAVSHQFSLANPTQQQSPLFYGDILEDRPFQKHFLIKTLQHRVKRSIRRTRMLWKFDPLNKTNFHQYIDNRENLVILIELQGDFVIGCYYQGKLCPKMVSDKDGLILSLTRKESFQPIQPNRRVVTYDDYYLIFGNSEIRIRSQQARFFSNFALSSGYFKSRGLKFDVLTNSSQREVPMKSWEVHQFELL